MKACTLFWLVGFVALAAGVAVAQDNPPAIAAALQQADRLFKDQHWAEAAAKYASVRTRLADSFNYPQVFELIRLLTSDL